jgi:hypothetical protein
VYQEEFADQLEYIGHGKSAAMTKIFNGIGTVASVQHQGEAATAHAEAVQLRDQLAQIEGQSQAAAVAPVP